MSQVSGGGPQEGGGCKRGMWGVEVGVGEGEGGRKKGKLEVGDWGWVEEA